MSDVIPRRATGSIPFAVTDRKTTGDAVLSGAVRDTTSNVRALLADCKRLDSAPSTISGYTIELWCHISEIADGGGRHPPFVDCANHFD